MNEGLYLEPKLPDKEPVLNETLDMVANPTPIQDDPDLNARVDSNHRIRITLDNEVNIAEQKVGGFVQSLVEHALKAVIPSWIWLLLGLAVVSVATCFCLKLIGVL